MFCLSLHPLTLPLLAELRRYFEDGNSKPGGSRSLTKAYGPWPMLIFVESGLKYADILDAYSSSLDEAERAGVHAEIRCVHRV